MNTKNLRGFTLIELLVVISIIGVIASIVLVSFSGSRDKAKLARGQQFDAQISHALGAYAVGIWRFEEGAGIDIHDESGYGNDGTFYGNPTPVFPDGVYSGTTALQFDGSNDYVKLDSDNFNEAYAALSISFWINTNTDTPTTYGMAMHRNDGTSVGSSVFFGGVRPNNELIATIGAGSPGPSYDSGRTGVIASSGTWYHVVCSWDGTTARTYVNGVEKKQYSLLAANFVNKPATTRFGASGDASGYLFNGTIDDVRIYSEALSASQIQQHYVQGATKHGIAIND